jgi:glycosyltransferase domain-containing protein
MLTIIMSSKDRIKFVEKQLNSYHYQRFEGQIIICDVSTDENFQILSNKINEFSNSSFEIILEKHPKISIHESIKLVLDKIKFDFVIWLPDDDFLVIEDAIEAIDFLKQNQDYSGCGGKGIYVNYEDNITTFSEINFQSLNNPSCYSRLIQHINNYQVVCYSVQRKKNFVNSYREMPKELVFILGCELIPVHNLVSDGKVNFLDNLFIVRVLHANRYLVNYIDNFFYESWSFSFNYLLNRLYKQIQLKEKKDIQLDIVKKNLIDVLKNFHSKQVQKFNSKNLKSRTLTFLNYILPKKLVCILKKIKYKYSKNNIDNIKKYKYHSNFLKLGDIF